MNPFSAALSGLGTGIEFMLDHLGIAMSAIFVKPLDNLESLWVLIPIYLGMMVADVFQEKKGTSMGNAISNSLIPFWGGVDFLRITMRTWDGGWTDIAKTIIASLIILYGLMIIIVGIYGKEIIKKIGRIREVSYVIIIAVPIYYDIVMFDWHYLVAAIMFFPIFYFFFEIVMRLLPDSKALLDEVKVIDSEMHHIKDEIEDFATGHHQNSAKRPSGINPTHPVGAQNRVIPRMPGRMAPPAGHMNNRAPVKPMYPINQKNILRRADSKLSFKQDGRF